MKLIPNWMKSARTASTVGIYLLPDRLVAIDENNLTVVLQRPIENKEPVSAALRAFINDNNWSGRRLNFVLSQSWFQLNVIDKPSMSEGEIYEAVAMSRVQGKAFHQTYEVLEAESSE